MKLIDKDAVVAKIKRRIKTNKECMLGLKNLDYYQGKVDALNDTLSTLDTLEVKEVDLKEKSYVKIDRKVLFEICDAILNHYGYSDINDCPENDSECFWDKWNDDFRKKVENIRNNS